MIVLSARHDRKKSYHYGFYSKLDHELLAIRAKHFSDAHFLGPHGAPCSGQVHIVNGGNKQYENCYDRENIDIGNVSGWLNLPFIFRIKVNAGEWLKVKVGLCIELAVRCCRKQVLWVESGSWLGHLSSPP